MSEKSQNLNLVLWEQTDYFSTKELKENWEKVDRHNHANNGGAPLNEESIPNNSIGTSKIKREAVTTENIARGAVGKEQVNEEVLVPLGGIIGWYPQAGKENPEGLFILCQGQNWENIPNNRMGAGGTTLKTGKVPDLTHQFISGSSKITAQQTEEIKFEDLEKYYSLVYIMRVR